jgi:hypothetical protein
MAAVGGVARRVDDGGQGEAAAVALGFLQGLSWMAERFNGPGVWAQFRLQNEDVEAHYESPEMRA